ncbi:unnamed protein product [Caenorhabditis nigoni]
MVIPKKKKRLFLFAIRRNHKSKLMGLPSCGGDVSETVQVLPSHKRGLCGEKMGISLSTGKRGTGGIWGEMGASWGLNGERQQSILTQADP